MDVKTELDKVKQLPKKASDWWNLQFGSTDIDMYREGQMQFRVKDHTYRNIYERGHVDNSDPKTFIYVVPLLAEAVFQFFALGLVPMLLMSMSAKAHGHLFLVWWALYLMPMGGLFRGLLVLGAGIGLYYGVKVFAERYWESQNADSDQSILDNDEYRDDSRIRQPEELAEDFDIFPDSGMHSKSIDVTAILSHIMLTNSGLKKIKMPLRSSKDQDIDGVEVHRNELLYDENDELVHVTKSMIDEDFGEKLWDSSGIPRPYGKNAVYIKRVLRHRYDADKLLYNPSHKYGKSKEKTVADKINKDWYMPEYEVQRPAGMYVVDTEPNNTMVLAMTRAGKGLNTRSSSFGN